jgi:hypothetical protein
MFHEINNAREKTYFTIFARTGINDPINQAKKIIHSTMGSI